jgi:hypothetical protein
VEHYLADLSRYGEWMPMVHSAVRDTGSPVPAWDVELRARVGPFARSKRLRMILQSDTHEAGTRTLVFERQETGGGPHSRWCMTVSTEEGGGTTLVSVRLEYGGSLWAAGVLDKVLASQIEEGKKGLVDVVGGRGGR